MKQNSKITGKAHLLINLILAQALITILIVYFQYTTFFKIIKMENQSKFFTFIIILGLCFAFGSVILVREIAHLSHSDAEAKAQASRLEEREQFIQILRSQHHDFINHLQVISGSIQMGKEDRARKYITQIVEDLSINQDITKLANTEVAALLLCKVDQAEKNGIAVEIVIETTLKNTPVPSSHLVRIFGNLLDNAIFALETVNNPNKVIEIRVQDEGPVLKLQVTNNVPLIPPELHEKIFEPGFTTKGEKGNGLGLANVKELAEKNGGNVHVLSGESKGTTFSVNLPNGQEFKSA